MKEKEGFAQGDKKRYQDFVSMTVHELKTPVTVLKAYLQMLTGQLRKDQQEGYIKTVEKMDVQLDKMLHLISDLQDGINTDAENIHCLMNKFCIYEALRSCADNVRTTNPDLVLETEIPEGELIVSADRDRIEQVVSNFIANGIKYSGKEKYIKIGCTATEEYVSISVTDKGIGISKDKQQEVFRQFYRVNTPMSQKQPGLGLGLYISAEIIGKHNGAIGVNSMEGEGSEFWFNLPLRSNG